MLYATRFLLALALPFAATSIEAEAKSLKVGAELLFAYSPSCSHCAYQRPIIAKFSDKHKGLITTTAEYSRLNQAQKSLISGTSGHPVMVFHQGDCLRQVVGETSLSDLEKEYADFKNQCASENMVTTGGYDKKVTTGSYVVCH